MKVWRVGIFCAFVAVVGAMAVCEPAWLATNMFLDALMSHELLALLVVILTITFASVANIHLAISRMVQQAPDPAAANASADGARREINSNAWTIFLAFIAAVIVLLVKGWAQGNQHVVAFAHAVGLAILLLNVLVLHDIYRSIFGLAQASAPLPNAEDGASATSEEDQT